MATKYKYDSVSGDDNTGIFLQQKINNVLNNLNIQLNKSGNPNTERKNAARIEYLLNLIIDGQKSTSSNNIITNIGKQQISDGLKQLGLSSYKWQTDIKDKSGTSFEDYFANLIDRILKNAKAKNIVTWDSGRGIEGANQVKNIGANHVDPFKNILKDAEENVINAVMQEVYKPLKEYMNSVSKAAETSENPTLSSVQGKCDIVSRHINFTVTDIHNKTFERVLSLLGNATFSLKGYLTSGAIKLGNPSPFRAFLAVTGNDLGAMEKSKRWYRMLQCMQEQEGGHPPHTGHESIEKFFLLRYIYELTGYGQSYSQDWIQRLIGNTEGVDYFIYYANYKGTITVLSTKAMIYDLFHNLQKAWQGRTLRIENKNTRITKDYALYAHLKLRRERVPGTNHWKFIFG